MPCVPERDPRNDSGFSLIEALIAAAILGAAVTSLAQLLIFGTTASAAAGQTTRASLLAADKIEELHATSVDLVGTNVADTPAPGVTRAWTVTALPSDPVNLALVEVTVRTGKTDAHMFAVQRRTAP